MRSLKRQILALFVLPLFFILACDDDGFKTIDPIDGGPDSGDVVEDHVSPPDVIDADPNGPEIVITAPTEGQVVSGTFLKITAVITSVSSTVDYESVTAYIEGTTYSMTTNPNVTNGFMVTVDLGDVPDGNTIVRVTAQDILERASYADVTFNYDQGPVFAFSSPLNDGRYHGAVNLNFTVTDNDGIDEDSVIGALGAVPISFTKDSESTETANGLPVAIAFTGNILFDDPAFVPALSGEQRLSFRATNGNGNTGAATLDFVVDNNGPTIVVETIEPGQLIGGIITVTAEIRDEAGVEASSTQAVIGNNSNNYVIDLSLIEGTNSYTGSFDTSLLPSNFIWPSLQVFATDKLGNESSIAFEVALDNQPPILALDPPEDFRIQKENADGDIECSFAFDPVGENAADDLSTVAQIMWIRARVEDRGNAAAGMAWSPLSLVDQSSVELYILPSSLFPLVIDTNGDGICDEINPELVPTIQLSTDASETLKLDMVALSPIGEANFQPDFTLVLPDLNNGCQAMGNVAEAPDPLCPTVTGDMTKAIWYTYDQSEPAIYTLPPVDISSSYMCAGIQFDSLANNIPEGWTCMAVRAVDNVGNV
ncbi:hypothetical protein KKF84_18995, partial [Myxococcota bacterium]|nr:hypothetical protein [Myxococcota bacterium]